MIFYITISVIAVIFGLVARNEKYDFFYKLAFILLATVWAIRYGWGNDYFEYLRGFENLKDADIFDFSKYRQLREKYEPVWLFLTLAFRPVGFFGFVAVLSIFENWVICRFIRHYVDRKYYWLALFLYVFNASFYLIGASMMRQWLAMCVVILASEYIEKRKIKLFILLAFIAAQIHTSAYISIVFFSVYLLPREKLNFRVISAIVLVFLIWLNSAEFIFKETIANVLSTGDYDVYTYLYDMEGREAWRIFGIITAYLFPFLPVLFTSKSQISDKRLICYLFMLSSFFVPLQNVAGLASRFVLYPALFGVAAWPIFMQTEYRNKIFKIMTYIILPIIVFLEFRGYLSTFTDPIWISSFMEYHTIFEVPWQ